MTDTEKLNRIKTLLGISDTSEDTLLTEYLSMAKSEILNWIYAGDIPSDVTDVPQRYEQTQVQAVIAGYSISGAEEQTSHTENGIARVFRYSDMLQYIHSHVIPMVGF